MSVMGVALIFATGLDHMFLRGIIGSYEGDRAGPAAGGDAAQLALEAASTSFRVGFQIAMPLIAAGLIFRVGMGVLAAHSANPSVLRGVAAASDGRLRGDGAWASRPVC